MNKLSFIMIHSKCDGMLYINNHYTGNLHNNDPISLPWDDSTKLNILFYPFGDKYNILCHSLYVEDGNIMPCGNSEITMWPELIELELKPQRNYSPIPLMPVEIDRNVYAGAGKRFTSTIVDYCGTWWIIEEGNTPLMCQHLSDERISGKLTRAIQDPVTLVFNDDKHVSVASYIENQFKLVYNGEGNASSQSGVVHIENVKGIENLNLKISYPGLVLSKEYGCQNNTVLSFLANVQSGKSDAAHQNLNNVLQTNFTPNDVMSFIGNFSELSPCRFTSFDGICYAVKEKVANNVYKAKSYGFELENSQISNIIELG